MCGRPQRDSFITVWLILRRWGAERRSYGCLCVRNQGVDASGNFGQCVISKEILSQSLSLFPILRPPQNGVHCSSNLFRGGTPGPKINARACPSYSGSGKCLFFCVAGNHERHTETERLLHCTVSTIRDQHIHFWQERNKRNECLDLRIGRSNQVSCIGAPCRRDYKSIFVCQGGERRLN